MNGPEDSDPITGVPMDDPDVPVYMPGTPVIGSLSSGPFIGQF